MLFGSSSQIHRRLIAREATLPLNRRAVAGGDWTITRYQRRCLLATYLLGQGASAGKTWHLTLGFMRRRKPVLPD
jgi:hypothetical protein